MDLMTEVRHTITDVDAAEWDAIVRAAQAPIFYTHTFLQAYEAAPLQQVETFYYVTIRDRATGQAVAVFPANLIRWQDPLGMLAQAVNPADYENRTILLSHIWHCYDTELPALALTAEIVEIACQTLAHLAQEAGAALYGFVNVKESPLLQMLQTQGFSPVLSETRFLMHVPDYQNMEAYLQSLSGVWRVKLRRSQRRVQELGVETIVERPPFRYLDDVVAMCQRMAQRHGNTNYYRPDVLRAFMLNLGDAARVTSVRYQERLIAGSLSFVDGQRFHAWAGGADYEISNKFSPYYVLFYQTVQTVMQMGLQVLEMGRRNSEFKLRFGLQPIELYVCVKTDRSTEE